MEAPYKICISVPTDRHLDPARRTVISVTSKKLLNNKKIRWDLLKLQQLTSKKRKKDSLFDRCKKKKKNTKCIKHNMKQTYIKQFGFLADTSDFQMNFYKIYIFNEMIYHCEKQVSISSLY